MSWRRSRKRRLQRIRPSGNLTLSKARSGTLENRHGVIDWHCRRSTNSARRHWWKTSTPPGPPVRGLLSPPRKRDDHGAPRRAGRLLLEKHGARHDLGSCEHRTCPGGGTRLGYCLPIQQLGPAAQVHGGHRRQQPSDPRIGAGCAECIKFVLLLLKRLARISQTIRVHRGADSERSVVPQRFSLVQRRCPDADRV
jgi:hypothetical protein